MLYYKKLLILILIFPIIGILMLWSLSKKQTLKIITLNIAYLIFILSLLLCFFFQKDFCSFQFIYRIYWLPNLNLNFICGVDGISLFFILLTTLLIPICLLASWNNINSFLKEFLIGFLFLDFLLIITFSILDLLLFYIFFESIISPTFLIIGIWGSWEWKILATYYFFFYTFISSTLMLLSILYIYLQIGTTDYEILMTCFFSFIEEKFLWITFFFAFASKIPMIPLHLWLLEAHVEAPTAGSLRRRQS